MLLTREGEEAFAMFADQLNDDDAKALQVEDVDYRITRDGEHITYEKESTVPWYFPSRF